MITGSTTAALHTALAASVDKKSMWSICGNLQDNCYVVNTGTGRAQWTATAKAREALFAAGLAEAPPPSEPQPAEAQAPTPPEPEAQAVPADQPTPEEIEAARLNALWGTPAPRYRPLGNYEPERWQPARPDATRANDIPSREGDRLSAYAGIRSQCTGHGQVLLAPSRLQR